MKKCLEKNCGWISWRHEVTTLCGYIECFVDKVCLLRQLWLCFCRCFVLPAFSGQRCRSWRLPWRVASDCQGCLSVCVHWSRRKQGPAIPHLKCKPSAAATCWSVVCSVCIGCMWIWAYLNPFMTRKVLRVCCLNSVLLVLCGWEPLPCIAGSVSQPGAGASLILGELGLQSLKGILTTSWQQHWHAGSFPGMLQEVLMQ